MTSIVDKNCQSDDHLPEHVFCGIKSLWKLTYSNTNFYESPLFVGHGIWGQSCLLLAKVIY